MKKAPEPVTLQEVQTRLEEWRSQRQKRRRSAASYGRRRCRWPNVPVLAKPPQLCTWIASKLKRLMREAGLLKEAPVQPAFVELMTRQMWRL